MSNQYFFRVPFATSGDVADIPVATDPGGAVSFTQGWGPDYSLDPATQPAAKRIPRDKTNFFYNVVTDNLRQYQVAGTPEWVTAAQNGGVAFPYDINAVVLYENPPASGNWERYTSLVTNNTATPGSDATKWQLTQPASFANLTEALAGTLTTKMINPNVLARAVQRGQWNEPTVGGSASAMTLTLSPAPSALADITGALLIFKPTVDSADDQTVNINGLGAVNIIRQDGVQIFAGDLTANRYAVGTYDGATFQILGYLPSLGRERLTGDTTLYVNASSGSNSNNGRTSGTAFQTLPFAVNWAYGNLDLNGFILTFSIVGAFTAGVAINGKFVGQGTEQHLVFAASSASSIMVTNNSCFYAGEGAAFTIAGALLTLNASGTGSGQGSAILSNSGSYVVYQNLIFGLCGTAHVSVTNGSRALMANNCTCSTGGAPYHWFVLTFSQLTAQNVTLVLNGIPPFASAFVLSRGSSVVATAFLFQNTATGPRYLVDSWGVIFTNGGGANYFPGNSAGTATAQGLYQ